MWQTLLDWILTEKKTHKLKIVRKILTLSCYKTQNLKILKISKTQNMIKHKNYKFDKTQNVTKPKMWQNSKSQNFKNFKQKMWQSTESKCDKHQKHEMWQNSKTQNVAKLKMWEKKTQKVKVWQN